MDEAGLLPAAGPSVMGMVQIPSGSCTVPQSGAGAGPGIELDQVLAGAHKTAQLADFYIAGYRLGFAAAIQQVGGAQQTCPNDGLVQLCNTLMLTRGVASQIQAGARAMPPDPDPAPLQHAGSGPPDLAARAVLAPACPILPLL